MRHGTWVTKINGRLSQETLYHAVGMIDGTLAMRDVDNAHLQLVAITSLLIAAKLEEYHPPSIKVCTIWITISFNNVRNRKFKWFLSRFKDLLAVTENSYSFDDVVNMERKLLILHDFSGYSAEPMVFINRFVKAAFQEGNSVFRNVCLLFYDCLIPTICYSGILVSKKAAAAVFAAREDFLPCFGFGNSLTSLVKLNICLPQDHIKRHRRR